MIETWRSAVILFCLVILSQRRLHVSPGGLEFDEQNAPQVSEWPHLIGKSVEEAKQAILDDRPEIKVVVVREGAMVTMDYRTDRVRVYADKGMSKVVRVPKIG